MKSFRLAAIGLAVVGAAALLWLLGGSAFARYRERQTERAWVQSFGTLQDLLKRYPRTATNDTARRLKPLVKPLELDLIPRTHDDVASSARSSNAEADRAWQAVSRSERNPLKRVETVFLRPYQDLVWSEVTEKMRLAYLRIKDSPLSDEKVSERNVGPKNGAAEIMLSIQMPNLLESFRRLDRLVLDTELTDKVLEARLLRLQNGSEEWPAAIPGIEVSRFPGAKWIYSVSPRGTMSLSLSKEPHWDSSGLVLPNRFTSF